jgi:pyruvate/2-oxoglutarate dehydrogenase complex dihydrolipoamide acyltransferase (E2) component
MATNVIMPRIGGTVVEGTVKKWLVQEGETVTRYQPIAEVSSEKVTIEVPAPVDGVVLRIYHPARDCVPVGTILAVIGAADETLPEQD